MGAVAVFLLRDDVRLAEIPVNDAFADVLFRESKGKSTTSGLAEMNAIFAVDLRLTLESILVVFGLLEKDADAFFRILFGESLRDFGLAFVKLVDGD